jgi:peptidoglycan hydrolase CwlO-like protein
MGTVITRQLSILRLACLSLLFGVFCLELTLLAQVPQVQAQANCESISCNKSTQAEDEYLSCNKEKQSCWENKIREAQGQAVTLSNTISIINGKLSVQQLQIEQTATEIQKLEREITELTNRIAGLDLSLDRLTEVLVQRVDEHYKRGRLSPAIGLLNTESLSQMMRQYKYRQLVQRQTADAMQRAESAKQTYDEQKNLKETKQTEVERKKAQLVAQQGELTKQRAEQQFLLQETKNNEAAYQRELEKTLSELQAIQSIIAGRGTESKVGDINQGDTIANIIVGASACSTGTHLHFEVVKGGAHHNPAGYLKSISASWNNSPDTAFGFGGDWDWPVNNPAKINQGYGMTYYARVRRAYGGSPHTGIDMASKDAGNTAVRAVKAGTLYRGSIRCGSGQLRYVRVEHKDSDISTYYLHVNY